MSEFCSFGVVLSLEVGDKILSHLRTVWRYACSTVFSISSLHHLYVFTGPSSSKRAASVWSSPNSNYQIERGFQKWRLKILKTVQQLTFLYGAKDVYSRIPDEEKGGKAVFLQAGCPHLHSFSNWQETVTGSKSPLLLGKSGSFPQVDKLESLVPGPEQDDGGVVRRIAQIIPQFPHLDAAVDRGWLASKHSLKPCQFVNKLAS